MGHAVKAISSLGVHSPCFCSSYFSFLAFGHFCQWSYENTKMLHNLCLHFASQAGQEVKNREEITQPKWPKYQKPKDKNMRWTKHYSFDPANYDISKKLGDFFKFGCLLKISKLYRNLFSETNKKTLYSSLKRASLYSWFNYSLQRNFITASL